MLVGETVNVNKTSTNKIRVFPMDSRTDFFLRTNETYDSMMEKIKKYSRRTSKNDDGKFKGYRGVCVLRELSYFDVGYSFLSDSLHNCYHGVAVSSVFSL